MQKIKMLAQIPPYPGEDPEFDKEMENYIENHKEEFEEKQKRREEFKNGIKKSITEIIITTSKEMISVFEDGIMKNLNLACTNEEEIDKTMSIIYKQYYDAVNNKVIEELKLGETLTAELHEVINNKTGPLKHDPREDGMVFGGILAKVMSKIIFNVELDEDTICQINQKQSVIIQNKLIEIDKNLKLMFSAIK